MLKKLWNDEAGQGMVEYGLIIALVGILLVGALTTMKDSLVTLFGKVDTAIK